VVAIPASGQGARHLALLANLSWPSLAYDAEGRRLLLVDCRRAQLVAVGVECLGEGRPIGEGFNWADVGVLTGGGLGRERCYTCII
jgi:hypothetical protein